MTRVEDIKAYITDRLVWIKDEDDYCDRRFIQALRIAVEALGGCTNAL